MERLWAPWRIQYITGEKPAGCVFCIKDDNREKLVLQRTEHVRILLNRYPYCNGHLLVAPVRHTASFDELSDCEMLELFRGMARCRSVLSRALAAEGFNIGMNLGKVAGAGVEDHLHFHVVPRWNGDTNFIAVNADVRVLPEALYSTFDKLLPFFTEGPEDEP
ncbi:HIT family protein [Geomesophilobacter sediminis]|uniref:HIT domain-containing protein n=1 Tax=Geomesophilobacter sediminis TaxID=2798584 RepID=A0A8J7M188_9BACT|nr:HIT domain-containing protein [Geomesophilobacter sediminis]MBJ6726766.1 HIT domain-containing protein [Geomesophilobacter sediminis]